MRSRRPRPSLRQRRQQPKLTPVAGAVLRVRRPLRGTGSSHDLDPVVGDGDIGIAFARGAAAMEDGIRRLRHQQCRGDPARDVRHGAPRRRRNIRPAVCSVPFAWCRRAGKAGMSDVPTWASAFSEGCLGISGTRRRRRGRSRHAGRLIPAAQALAGPAYRRAGARRAAAHGSFRPPRAGQGHDRPDDAAARALRLAGHSSSAGMSIPEPRPS